MKTIDETIAYLTDKITLIENTLDNLRPHGYELFLNKLKIYQEILQFIAEGSSEND